MERDHALSQIISRKGPWDIAVIGGGATGVGICLDAASRGYDACLLEQSDFGKGASSRSTKLIHGGVRYLQQGNVSLVMEALKERGLLRQNAPHLVHDLAFIVPNYSWWQAPFYGIGMKVYDLLAGRYGFGHSRLLSKQEVLQRIPTLEQSGLRGGVLYFDGQFDDSRLLINLAQTAHEQGGALLNYAQVVSLSRDGQGFIDGLSFTDIETGKTHAIKSRCVINATGPFSDAVRRLDDPSSRPMIAPSQGVHLVLDRSFLPGDSAMLVPHTNDGRILFAIPWHGHTLLGTTDTPLTNVDLEPQASDQEIDFILQTASKYLHRPATRGDVLSVFAGIRPLVRAADVAGTAALSREHTIDVSKSGLITIAGGKWTTYRKMAEDCVDHAATIARLDDRPCVTKSLPIHGHQLHADSPSDLNAYGSDAPALRELMESNPELAQPLHPALPTTGAQILWAARKEMARTVEDALARRTRALFLNSAAALAMAPKAAAIMADELKRDRAWQENQIHQFALLAAHYSVAKPAPKA